MERSYTAGRLEIDIIFRVVCFLLIFICHTSGEEDFSWE